MDVKNLILGLDIGTSSIKLVLFNEQTKQVEFELNRSTAKARIEQPNNPLLDEQDVDIIVDLLKGIFAEINDDYYKRLKAVRLCGQMHGIVLWNSLNHKHSSLVTWQDARCSKDFIESLPVKSRNGLFSGYGCATLFWYALNGHKDFIDKFDSSGTIHDYIAYLLCGNILMSNQNAYAWGYFDDVKMDWQNDLKECSLFPFGLLPKIVNSETIQSNWVTLLHNSQKLENVHLYVSLGDMQSSVLSCLENNDDCVINISTSSQICIAVDKTELFLIEKTLPKSIIVAPFFGNYSLLVSASLNGGNVMEKFVNMVISWYQDLGFLNEISHDGIWHKIIELGIKFCEKQRESCITCRPTLFAERHDLARFASLSNISNGCTSIGEIFTCICRGIASNLHEMITERVLFNECKSIQRLVCTGSAVIRNEVLQKQIEYEFKINERQIPLVFKATSDAALGVCLSLIK